MNEYIKIDNNELTFHVNNENIIVNLSNVTFCESDGNYVRVHVLNSKKFHMIRSTINALHELLPPDYFVLVHRGYIININNVTSINGVYVNIEGVKIPVPTSHRKDLLEKLLVL